MSHPEILAYVVIGLTVLLVVGGVLFLAALSAFEKLSDWRIGRAGRNRSAPMRDKSKQVR